ncbi:ribonuclease H2 subunit B-like [Panonychus citri]|uniref:ribonuclease H2 subunit B-like n=1 Tax=Panonychus citri TaxID=50023 RepID=UPI002306F590|nr:ribonuclease H2 subunit B-like [Panonychus citri]
MADEEADYKIITLPTCCVDRKLKSFTFGKNGCYLYDDKYNNVYEIVQYSEDRRSWFVGERVVQNGSLQMVTQVDPLFIILPNLIGDSKLFKSLEDIFGDDKGSTIMIKIFETNKRSDICCIADVKELDNEIYYRLDEKKLITWLKAKVNQIINCLQQMKIEVSVNSTKIAGFSSARDTKTDEKEYIRYAVNLLSKYLPEDVLTSLREIYNLEKEKEIEPETKPIASSTPKGQKRPIDGAKCEPIDNYCKEEVPVNGAAKKAKLSRSQKELEKASKQSGIRSISSFFTKKPSN